MGKTVREIVAEIVQDIPEMKHREEELVIFMEKVQDLNTQMVTADGYYARKQITDRITALAQKISQNGNGGSRSIRNEALNRIFDHIEGRMEDD